MGSDLALQQQVETLYQQTTESDQEFCIDLEGQAPDGRPVWEWMGYSTKGSATRSLSKLVEGVDFLLNSSVKQTLGSGGHNREVVLFSRDGFKQWGMLAGTDRGRQIRLYFIECEKRLQLGMSQPTALNRITENLAELSGLVTGGFAQVGTQIKGLRSDVNGLANRVEQLEKNRHKRKDPPLKHQRQYRHLVATAYGGACPCCKQQKAHMQFDHWYDRSRADLDEVWLICTDCNRKLGAAGSPEREHYRRQFEGFHDRLSELTTGNQIKLDFGSIHEPA